MNSDIFVDQVVNGVALGAMYALFGVGFSLVYGVMELVNFAHLSVFVAGSFVALGVAGLLSGPMLGLGSDNPVLILIVLIAVVLACGSLGMGIDKVIRPLPTSGPGRLIATVGIGLVIQNFILLVAGPWIFQFPISLPESRWEFLGFDLQVAPFVVLAIAILGFIGLYWFTARTETGRAMRAVRDDREAARMMGVNIEFVIRTTFFISAALAGVAGLVFGAYYGQIQYLNGVTIGLRGFAAAVLGGIGNPFGALLGGLVVGLVESLGGQLLSVSWAPVIIYCLLILTLLVRPGGIFVAARSQRT